MIQNKFADRLFWGLLALFLTPLFLFRFLPSEDGPTHIYNSLVLRDWFSGHAGWVNHWLMLNPALPPNVLGHALAALLLSFLPQTATEKIVIALYVVGLATGFRLTIRAVRQDSQGLELLVFPFILTSHLHWGFYNFCFSVAAMLWSIGVYLRTRQNLFGLQGALLAGLLVLTVLASPVGFAEALICIGILELLLNGLNFRRLASLVAICLPALAIYAVFMLRRLPSPDDKVDWPSLKYAAAQLVMLLPIATWGIQFWLAKAVVLLYVLVSIAVLRSASPVCWRFAILAGIAAVLLFIAPASATGGTMITPRLAYMPFFAWTLWVADNMGSLPRYIAVATVGLALAFLVSDIRFDRSYDASMRQFLEQVPPIPAGSTFWFQTFAPGHAVVLDPALNGPALSGGTGAYIAARDRLVLLDNYEAHTNHFPLHFQPGKDPFSRVAVKSKTRSFLDCADVAGLGRVGEAPGYVLQWGAKPDDVDFRSCGYEAIVDSAAPERLTLFRRK